MPATLNCPNCGAAANESATTCEYCGSGLVAVACRACFGAMFAGAQFCPHCGAKAEQPVAADPSTLRCPGCRGEMRHQRVADTSTIYECSACGAAWLSPAEFTKLIADRETRAAAATHGAEAGGLSQRKPRRLTAATTRYVRCPVCDMIMNRVNFGDRSGVIVDTCAAHGIWFEREELHAILNFVEEGGLARRPQDRRSELRELQFDSEQATRQRDAIRTLITHLDDPSRSGQSGWSDFLKVFFG